MKNDGICGFAIRDWPDTRYLNGIGVYRTVTGVGLGVSAK